MKSNWDEEDEETSGARIITGDPPADSILTCMEGDATRAKWAGPSTTGLCEKCGKTIHYSSTAPTHIRRYCRECVYNKMMASGGVPDIAITETTLKEAFGQLGIPDTPETRKRAIEFCQTRYAEWLKEGVGRV